MVDTSVGGASVVNSSTLPEGSAVVDGAGGGACRGLHRLSRHTGRSEGQALHELPDT